MKMNISRAMLKDHKKIGDLLETLKKGLNQDTKTVFNLFDNFTWNLQKHFFIEEKVILIDYDPSDENSSENLSKILEEHDSILKIAIKLREELIKNKKIDISELRSKLIKHRNYENETLYPMLDMELNSNQKKLVLEKIREYYKW